MILLVHMIFGAAIGSATKSMPAAIILAFLSHYFLDSLPHIEYNVENVKNRQWRKALPDILKIFLDFCLGLLFILVFSKNHLILYICAILAIIPDGFTLLNYFFLNKISDAHNRFHKKIHFLKNKKFSRVWRISFQLLMVIFSILLLVR